MTEDERNRERARRKLTLYTWRRGGQWQGVVRELCPDLVPELLEIDRSIAEERKRKAPTRSEYWKDFILFSIFLFIVLLIISYFTNILVLGEERLSHWWIVPIGTFILTFFFFSHPFASREREREEDMSNNT